MAGAETGSSSGEPLLAFVHIPRTGGGSVSAAISSSYGRLRGSGNAQKSPEKTAAKLRRIASRAGQLRAVGDHTPYGLFLRFLPADTRYLTFLREPVDRVLSHYYFHARAGSPEVRRIWEELATTAREPFEIPDDAEFSLEEGLAWKIVIYDNLATRLLSGSESLFGDLAPDAVERAKENISRFLFVGITERFDESIVLAGRTLGVGVMPYRLRHVNPERVARDEIAPELRELIARHNALDVELYRFARERFDEQAEAAGDLASQLEELRRLSAEATRTDEKAQASQRAATQEQRMGAKAARKAERAKQARGMPVLRPEGASRVAFVHIPRTGGGTVTSALANGWSRPKSPGNAQLNPEKVRSAIERLGAQPDRWRALADHVPYGLYRRHLPGDTAYVTFLREPVDRVLSHYDFLRKPGRNPKSDPVERDRRGAAKFEYTCAFLEYQARLERWRNSDTASPPPTEPPPREIACRAQPTGVSLEDALARRVCIFDNLATRLLSGQESLFGDLAPDALEQAKENLSRLVFVGITERFDESIVLLGRALGVGLMPYHLRHVSRTRPALDDVPAELRRLVAETNALDVELYRFARERFDEAAAAAGDLTQDVEALRRQSVEVTRIAKAALDARNAARGKVRETDPLPR